MNPTVCHILCENFAPTVLLWIRFLCYNDPMPVQTHNIPLSEIALDGTHGRKIGLLSRLIQWKSGLLPVTCLACAVFALQVRTLPWIANTSTDEGAHAEAGRMIFEGYMPYRDFYYSHPPLLPLFIGLGLQLSGGMFLPRLIYLFLNIFSVIPLFMILRRISGTYLGALVAIVFYLTWYQMVDHDFRFIETRQFANVFFIAFLYFAIVRPDRRWSSVYQTIFSIASVFTVFPIAADLLFVSLAIIFSAPSVEERRRLLRHFVTIGIICTGAVLLLWITLSHSLELTLLFHAYVSVGSSRMDRIGYLVSNQPDTILYTLSIASLLWGALRIPRMRAYCLAGLGMILLILVPREFFPHYFVTAGVAFAIGLATFAIAILQLFRSRSLLLAYLVIAGMTTSHLTRTLPPLLASWQSADVSYYASIQELAGLPGPMLTFMEQIWAIDAKKEIVQHYYRAGMRYFYAFGKPVPDDFFAHLSDRACTIVLPGWDQAFVPSPILHSWLDRYRRLDISPHLLVLATDHPFCTHGYEQIAKKQDSLFSRSLHEQQ